MTTGDGPLTADDTASMLTAPLPRRYPPRVVRLVPFPAALHRALQDGTFAASGLRTAPDWPNPELREALPFLTGVAEANPGWSWLIVEEEEVVGEIGLKGAPVDGLAEVGYGVCASRRGRGYASRALQLLIRAVPVTRLVAETEAGNTASERVLTRAGFRRVRQEPGRTWWYLEITPG